MTDSQIEELKELRLKSEQRRKERDDYQMESGLLDSALSSWKSRAEKAEARLKIAEEALKFYGDTENYTTRVRVGGGGFFGIEIDLGDKAREALRKIRGEK